MDKLNVSFGDSFEDKLCNFVSDVDDEGRLALIDKHNFDFACVITINDACRGGDAFE